MQETAVPPMSMQSADASSSGVLSPGSATGIPPAGNLTSAEVEGLLAQQDEEKFLRDAYQELAATFLTVQDFNAMAMSADRLFNYGNTMVPSDTSLEPASYIHGDPRQIFRSYISTAGSDPTDGLTAAAMIEDIHIADLTPVMLRSTNPNLRDLYIRELTVARNNLRTIVSGLNAAGISYTPQYLDYDTYNGIITSPMEPVTIPSVPAPETTIASLGVMPPTTEMQLEFAALPAGTLSAAEIQDVLQLQEEEKFEHDLFTTLYGENPDLLQLQMLGQSAAAEMNADNVVLQRYGITYTPLDTGQFSNPNLQYLYNTMIGNASILPSDILSTVAQSEELHIADLSGAITRTDNPDLKYVYSHQLALDRNDLREIASELRARGVAYSPQYITPQAYNAIIATPPEMVP